VVPVKTVPWQPRKLLQYKEFRGVAQPALFVTLVWKGVLERCGITCCTTPRHLSVNLTLPAISARFHGV
jgi:hypothetical protein